jgi:RNA polymerase sigma factor (sigma-70 family)
MANFNLELIEEAKSGKQKALTDLYNILLPYVKGILFNISGNRFGDWMNELAHEITSHLLSKNVINRYESRYKFTSWVSVVTQNKFKDYLKYKKCRQNVIYASDLILNEDNDENYNIINYTDNILADLNFIKKEEYDRIVNIINFYLPNDMRIIIRMWYLEELTQDEIAKITGYSTNKIGVIHHRAKQKLREIMNIKVINKKYRRHE